MSRLYGSYAVNGSTPVNAATRHTSVRSVDLHFTVSNSSGWESDYMIAIYFVPTEELQRRVALSPVHTGSSRDAPRSIPTSKNADHSVVNNVAGVMDSVKETDALIELSCLPWHAVFSFDQSAVRSSFTIRVPSWISSVGTPGCVRGYGAWLFTRREGHKLANGTLSPLWEREAFGWSGSLKRMDGSSVCSVKMKMTTSSVEVQKQMSWLLEDYSKHTDVSTAVNFIRAYNDQVHEYWHAAKNWPSFDHLGGLEKWYDSSRKYPIFGVKDCLPMFSHLVPVTFDIPLHPVNTPTLFNHLAELSAARLGYSPREFVEATTGWETDHTKSALMMELTSEVCTFWLHTIEYTVDHQHGTAVDEWEFLNNAIDPHEARYDCEDGTEYIVRMVKTIHAMSGLRSGQFNPYSSMSPLMVHLAEFVSHYEPVMALCTLRLQGQGEMGSDLYTYHACAVMLDREYLEMHAHLILGDTASAVASSGVLGHEGGDSRPDASSRVGAHVDFSVLDVDGDGIIHVHESQGRVAARHAKLVEEARQSVASAFRTAFVLEPTTYVAAARFPAGVDKSVDDIVFTAKTDSKLPDAFRRGDGTMKLSNTGMYGREGEHCFYGRVLFFVSPMLLDRGLADMVLFNEKTPTTKSVPMTDFLNYSHEVKMELPSESVGEHLGDFVRAISTVMAQMPMFVPVGSGTYRQSQFSTGDLAVVSSQVSNEWWPYYVRPHEVAGFFDAMGVDRKDSSIVREHTFNVCSGCELVQILVNKSTGSKFEDIMTHRFVYS